VKITKSYTLYGKGGYVVLSEVDGDQGGLVISAGDGDEVTITPEQVVQLRSAILYDLKSEKKGEEVKAPVAQPVEVQAAQEPVSGEPV